jgi:7 transmembrane sweet-taste receptor of 3 GCPR
MMAIDHFNQRNTTVISEIATIDPNCSIYFTDPAFIDTETDGGLSVRALYDIVDEREEKPCAVLGSVEGSTNMDIIPAINTYEVPLISYYTDDATLVTEKGTIGLTISADGRAKAMVQYLKIRQYLAYWYVAESDRETALADALVKYGTIEQLQVEIFRIQTDDNIRDNLQRLKDSGIKTILLSVPAPVDLYQYSILLEELQMLESEFIYILPPELVPTDYVSIVYGELVHGTPLDKLLSGAFVFDRLDGFRLNPNNDRFYESWKQQGNETIDKMNSLVPNSAYYLAAPGYFQKVKPANFASYVYDAVMTIGLGACIAEKEAKILADELAANGASGPLVAAKEKLPPPFKGFIINEAKLNETQTVAGIPSVRALSIKQAPLGPKTTNIDPKESNPSSRHLQFAMDENTTAARGTLLAGMLETKFVGASGMVDFGNEVGKERNANTISMGLYNVRPENVTGSSNNNNNNYNQTFFAFLVYTYNNETWTRVPDTAIQYRDGTTDEPDIRREYVNENYISQGVRIMGLFLMTIAWLLALVTLIGLQIYSKDPVVQRAQPFFLKMLCYGSLVMSSAIFTLSWDEGAGWSDHQLDIACSMTPWFFFVGQIVTFCALFTKLWRVDKVLQFRRRAVTVSNVMKPW